jgi:succinoglycan biosynthesis protein ExoA
MSERAGGGDHAMIRGRPRVSLLIAMRNEEPFIERCLTSIAAQDYAAECLEVLVLDGASTDRSREIAERVCAGRPSYRVHSNPGIIQACAWNLGAERSTGDIVGIVSAHAELARDYVSCAVETLERTGAELVGGPVRAIGGGWIGRAVARATSTPFGVGGARFHYAQREEEVDTVFMGLCRREVFERLGGFDTAMVRNQDDELSYRLRGQGGRIVCNPAIRSRYHNRATLRSLIRQYFAYGYWKVEVMRRHPRQMRPRHFVPAAFVGARVGAAFAATTRAGWLPVASVAGSYALANVGAAFWTVRRGEWDLLPVLPVVFAALHLTYGVGVLAGGIHRLTKRLTSSRRRQPT